MLKSTPWHMAQMRRVIVTNMTLGLLWSQMFWETWAEVMYPGHK